MKALLARHSAQMQLTGKCQSAVAMQAVMPPNQNLTTRGTKTVTNGLEMQNLAELTKTFKHRTPFKAGPRLHA